MGSQKDKFPSLPKEPSKITQGSEPQSGGTIARAISLLKAAGPFENPDHLVQFLIDDCQLSDSEAIQVSLLDPAGDQIALPAVTDIELFVTEACNLRCPYCFVEGKESAKKMSLETAEKALDFLFQNQGSSISRVGITFFGGEPFANFELIKKIANSAAKRAKKASVPLSLSATTNGTLLNHEKLEFCRDRRINFLLSIDGIEEAHDSNRFFENGKGSWRKIIDKLPTMRQYQPWLGAKMTVAPEWADRMLEGVVELARQGINQVLVGPATGVNWTKSQSSILREQTLRVAEWYFGLPDDVRGHKFRINYKDFQCSENEYAWGCRAGRSTISVSVDGSIFPCAKMAGVNGTAGVLPLGNILAGVPDVNTRKILSGILPAARHICRQCSLSNNCMGGCYATNFQDTGDPFLPSKFGCSGARLGKELSTIFKNQIQVDAERTRIIASGDNHV